MRNHKTALRCWAAAMMLCLLFAQLPLFAAGTVDLTHDCTLTIRYEDAGKPLSGAPFSLWRVADLSAYGELTLTKDFASYPVRLDGVEGGGWRSLAETLTGYVLRDRLTPLDSGKTDKDGILVFPNRQPRLLPGLYLVYGSVFQTGASVYTAEPFLILLPETDPRTNTWQYDLTAAPKHTREDIPTIPSQTVTRKVLKVWNDSGHDAARPESITVQLLKNGIVYDTVTLTRAGSWRHTWDKLPKYDADGSLIDWRVTETAVSGYTVRIDQDGGTIVITNTNESSPPSPVRPAQPSLPQTGVLWWPVVLLAALGLCLLLAAHLSGGRKRHG